MLRLDIYCDAVAVAGRGMDGRLVHTRLAHQLLRFDAVLLRELLKIQIVQQSDRRPEIGLAAVAELFGIPAHDRLDRQRVLKVKMILIVFCEQHPCLCPLHNSASLRGFWPILRRKYGSVKKNAAQPRLCRTVFFLRGWAFPFPRAR